MTDKVALRRKYAQERHKRLRPDGSNQYLQWTDDRGDPFAAVTERSPVRDHVTVACVGGGFGGLATCARLVAAGVTGVRVIDRAGDFGGVWYWNRYPGAQCDTASFVYLPLLEETGHMPSEKYVHGPEILEHCQRIGKQYGLYDNALFHTAVTGLRWDADRSLWTIHTDRGDEFTARFVVLGTGALDVPKLPGIPGLASFRGHSFHTGRWDYRYTGGDPGGTAMAGLRDKRVALIGTGATAVQCVPELARSAEALYVFQRTPSSIDVRANSPTDPTWFAAMATPGWQRRWLDNFTANQTRYTPDDLVMDGWTGMARRAWERIVDLPPEELTAEGIAAAHEEADLERMEEIRARVDAVVTDPVVAQRLKAWYRQECKRPCFSDDYLQAFNNPHTHLVDTDGRGVERITATGPVVDGVEYEVDCIIFASGFDVARPYPSRAGFDLTGRWSTLSDHWRDGMRTLHGIHVHGFPNVFIVQAAQGAQFVANIPHNLAEVGAAIAGVIAHAVTNGYTDVEATSAAEDAWVELVLGAGPNGSLAECTPGSYTNEGLDTAAHRAAFARYPKGATAFFHHLRRWLRSGAFEGLELRTGPTGRPTG